MTVQSDALEPAISIVPLLSISTAEQSRHRSSQVHFRQFISGRRRPLATRISCPFPVDPPTLNVFPDNTPQTQSNPVGLDKAPKVEGSPSLHRHADAGAPRTENNAGATSSKHHCRLHLPGAG